MRKKDTGQIYAMKVMRKEKVIEKEHGSYVRAESEILKTVLHPYIVTLRYSFQVCSLDSETTDCSCKCTPSQLACAFFLALPFEACKFVLQEIFRNCMCADGFKAVLGFRLHKRGSSVFPALSSGLS